VIQLLDKLHCVLDGISVEEFEQEEDDRLIPKYDKLVSAC
jgi:hypothetical protein